MQTNIEQIASFRCFGGDQRRYQHHSDALGCDMRFSIFLPECASVAPVPLLLWLSGLTCTDENFVQKAGAQRMAAELGVAVLAADTSPRGERVPDDPEGAYDFGLGAGFYVNATRAPYAAHYQMQDYITKELLTLVAQKLPVQGDNLALSGHSMGGHGALTFALKQPTQFRSVSAFAPICAPMSCAWGQKAFRGYLGDDESTWRAHDATALIKSSAAGRAAELPPILIDQGGADEFLTEQLQPDLFLAAAKEANVAVDYRLQRGYDHSYFFIASFIAEHLRFHRKNLTA